MKNIYHKHRLKYETREDAEEMLQSKPLTNDRKYIQDQMKPIIECLDKHHVKKYSDFIKLLHDYGFMARDHFLFINSFVTYIKETKKQDKENDKDEENSYYFRDFGARLLGRVRPKRLREGFAGDTSQFQERRFDEGYPEYPYRGQGYPEQCPEPRVARED